jgi:hypothetical protein
MPVKMKPLILLLLLSNIAFADGILTPAEIEAKAGYLLKKEKVENCLEKRGILESDSQYQKLNQQWYYNYYTLRTMITSLWLGKQITKEQTRQTSRYYLKEAAKIVNRMDERKEYLIKYYWDWCLNQK